MNSGRRSVSPTPFPEGGGASGRSSPADGGSSVQSMKSVATSSAPEPTPTPTSDPAPTLTPALPPGATAMLAGVAVDSEGKPVKRMTAAQMARWEAEVSRLQAIAEEEERSRREEIERQWALPLIPRLIFNDTTRNKEPSISPRDRLSYQSDKRYLKEFERFREKNTNLHKFLVMMHTEILRVKPDNILNFLAEEYLSPENEPALRKEVNRIWEE